jgi:hypothetical protein
LNLLAAHSFLQKVPKKHLPLVLLVFDLTTVSVNLKPLQQLNLSFASLKYHQYQKQQPQLQEEQEKQIEHQFCPV